MVVFREGEGALQVLPALVDILPEARLNLVVYYLRQGENEEAYELIKDLEPAIPQEYILKAIVNVVFGQDKEDVRNHHSKFTNNINSAMGIFKYLDKTDRDWSKFIQHGRK